MIVDDLTTLLRDRKAVVGVIGLGYVGLPLCLTIAEAGMRVVGFDLDASKPPQLENGVSYIKHIPSERIRAAVKTSLFSATSDFTRLKDADAILICVPTPLTAHREPNLSYVISTGETIAEYLRSGQLIILESTTYPGTTREVLRPILEKSGLKSGKDFFLAFSPEREDPGNRSFGTAQIPKVVGGEGTDAL